MYSVRDNGEWTASGIHQGRTLILSIELWPFSLCGMAAILLLKDVLLGGSLTARALETRVMVLT